MKKTEINIDELIKAYETTTSMHKLGEMFHTSHIRIKKLLIEAGIELKTDSDARLKRLLNNIINEYQSNDKITSAELSKKYNIPLVKLRKAFNENGIKIDQWRNHIKKTYQPKYKINYILGRNATTEDLINKGEKLFGKNRYDYSLTHFTKMHDKIKVICHEKDKNGNEHGVFETKATNFING
jgi:predicted transcriptional regulator